TCSWQNSREETGTNQAYFHVARTFFPAGTIPAYCYVDGRDPITLNACSHPICKLPASYGTARRTLPARHSRQYGNHPANGRLPWLRGRPDRACRIRRLRSLPETRRDGLSGTGSPHPPRGLAAFRELAPAGRPPHRAAIHQGGGSLYGLPVSGK